jgi:polar amino acid transport system permease protein
VTIERGPGLTEPGAAPVPWNPSGVELERRSVRRAQDRRRALVAIVSSVVVLGALVAVVVTSTGWPVVKETFFDVSYGLEVLPQIWEGFLLNLRLAAIAAVSIAVLALVIALVRTSTAPALAPFRILATVYVDVFRGVPLLLVILLIGFGIPALQLTESPIAVEVLGTTAVVLTYSAYVAEVIRSGVLSVHPSQRAAARALGLTQVQTLRFVVLPQAIRRVIPPLLNDLVALLKDIGLISILGAPDAIREAQIATSLTFNYTPYVVASILFLLVTIPLTRLTDRLLERSIARQNAQGTA